MEGRRKKDGEDRHLKKRGVELGLERGRAEKRNERSSVDVRSKSGNDRCTDSSAHDLLLSELGPSDKEAHSCKVVRGSFGKSAREMGTEEESSNASYQERGAVQR